VDLLPKPDQVVSAAGNLAQRVVRGGLADLRPMPRTLVAEGDRREVYHYQPAAGAGDDAEPVLLVTPLAAPALCYDLRRGCSLVEHLVEAGRPTYLVEYGDVSFEDRDLGIEHWVDDVVPAAVRAVSRHAGGRPVHLVGWSLGGVFALLAAADDAALPVASIAVLGTPFDVRQVPLVAPLRPLLDLGGALGPVNRLYQAVGGTSQPLLGWAFQLSAVQRVVTKPLALARHLDDADFLAQIEAVDRLTSQMAAYPGRTYGQLYHRLLTGNTLAEGRFQVGGRTLTVADVTAPVLIFGGATDQIAPIAAVRAAVPLLSGAREARFEIVPGGHLGMLTGREARTTTWPVLEAWVEEWTGGRPAAAKRRTTKRAAVKKTATRKTVAKKTVAKKTAAKKTAAKKTAAKKTAAKKGVAQKSAAKKAVEPDEIGTNPERRYGSGGSRALRR
jgi:polyhydroxyalkanoate synthase